MKAWDALWHGPIAPVRPYLLLKGALLLLAFDCWVDLVPHGGRYGIGGFNVAHFALLDALQPTPTPGVYVAMLLITGLLAFTMVVGRPTRAGLGCLFVLYTYGWSMSMLDSYQHHYLLSLLLLSFVFLPTRTASEVFGRVAGAPPPPGKERGEDVATDEDESKEAKKSQKARKKAKRRKASASSGRGREKAAARRAGKAQGAAAGHEVAWAYAMVGVSCAIVYFYTAVTKTEPDWRGGDALARLANPEMRAGLAAYLEAYGPSGGTAEDYWAGLAKSTILLQLVISSGYLVSIFQSRFRGLWRYLPAVWVFAPISFHIGAERMGLQIGWFSYYMMWIALVFFLPERWLLVAGGALTWPVRRLVTAAQGWFADLGQQEGQVLAACTFAAVIVLVLGTRSVDLPGAATASLVASVGLVALVGVALRSGDASAARGLALGAALASAALVFAMANSVARYDFYRFSGGDYKRRGHLEEALSAYVLANRYAPRDPAQDAAPEPCSNPEPLGFAWNGSRCLALTGCGCRGEDCDALEEFERDCRDSFRGHRDEKEAEVRALLSVQRDIEAATGGAR